MEVEKFFRRLTRCIDLLCCVMFALMCFGVTAQVVVRYTTDVPAFWVEELARFAMIWIVFLGTIAGIYRNAHTRVEFFVSRLPRRAQLAVKSLTTALCIGFLAVLIRASWGMSAMWSMMRSTALDIPMLYIYGSLGFCALFMILYLLRNLYREFFPLPEAGE